MDRKTELLQLCEGLDGAVKTIILPLVDNLVFLENKIEETRQYEFLAVSPKTPTRQRPTAAYKQYKELTQQYNNTIKIMLGAVGKSEVEEESPLRAYLNQMKQR